MIVKVLQQTGDLAPGNHELPTPLAKRLVALGYAVVPAVPDGPGGATIERAQVEAAPGARGRKGSTKEIR